MKKFLLVCLCFFVSIVDVHATGCSSGNYTTATGDLTGSSPYSATIGTLSGTSTTISPICSGTNDGMRTQYTILSSELANAGFVAGPINSIAFDLTAASGTVPDFRIRISDTPFPDLISDFDEMIFTDVFGPQSVTAPSSAGLFTFNFQTPYIWDGLSNILIDICHGTPTTLGVTPQVSYFTTAFDRTNHGTGSQTCIMPSGTTSLQHPVITLTQKLDYANNSNCSYLISPPAGFNTITLNFTEFITESTNDVVTVYDGPTNASPVLGQFSGNLNATLPSVNSTGNQMLVTFITNNTIVASGWAAHYTSNNSCLPSISINGNTTICSGEQANFSATLQNAGNAPVIEWFVNNVSQFTGSTFNTSSLNNSDNVKAVLTSNAACASSTTVTSNIISMNVNASPNVGINSTPANGTVCSGGSVTLSGTGAQNYSWNGITDGVPFQPAFSAPYTVTGSDINGCTGSASINVIVSPPLIPAITTASGSFSICECHSLVLDAGAGFSNYNWNTGATSQTLSVSTAGLYTVTVTDANGCTGSASQLITLFHSKPSKPGNISGPTSGLCSTTGNIYSVLPVANATSYNWTASNGNIMSGQGTSSITVDFGVFSSSCITVTASNACGTSSIRTLNISAKPKTPSLIIGNKKGICTQTETYSILPVSNATGYQWNNPPHTTILNGQGTISITLSVDNNFESGSLSVKAYNACGNSSTLFTGLKGEPAKPISISGPAGVCRYQSGIVYTTTPVYGATSYYWKVPPHAIIQSGQNTTSITVKFGNVKGDIEVRAVNNCGISDEKKFKVKFICRENEPEKNDEISVFPNPASDFFNISIPSEAIQKCTVQIFDVAGRLVDVLNYELKEGENLFEYSKFLQNGIYVLQIIQENGDVEMIRVAKTGH